MATSAIYLHITMNEFGHCMPPISQRRDNEAPACWVRALEILFI